MPLPKSWTTVTPLSKSIAFILFFLLPFIGFSAGMRYQQKLDQAVPTSLPQRPSPSPTIAIYSSPIPSVSAVMCPQDAKDCGDGKWVGRTGLNCEFICPKNN